VKSHVDFQVSFFTEFLSTLTARFGLLSSFS